MTIEQSETLNYAIGKFMALGFLNPADVDAKLTEASLPVRAIIDGLNAEVERLNKALEQALRYEEWVYSDEKRCPELAAWLKENR